MTRKLILLIMAVLIMNSGCSVYMAAKKPDKKDLSVFDKGTERAYLIAECGQPVYTETIDGNKKKDIFVFIQGYSDGEKAGRAIVHGAADVLTLGLWEIVATPIEGVEDGTEVKVEVCYDEADRVDYVKILEGEKRFNNTPNEALEPKEAL